MLFDKSTIIISGAVVVKEDKGKDQWLLVKQTEGAEWEFSKSVVRKGESSVRTAIRVMSEKGGMSTRVLEEVGRINGTATNGGKTNSQKTIYYLMLLRSNPKEIIGFNDFYWGDYAQVLKKLSSKKEQGMLKDAKVVYKDWKKNKKAKFDEQEALLLEESLEQERLANLKAI